MVQRYDEPQRVLSTFVEKLPPLKNVKCKRVPGHLERMKVMMSEGVNFLPLRSMAEV